MKILITEFMETKSVEMLQTNFNVTVDQDLSTSTNELKKMNTIKNKFYAITAGKKGVYWIENGIIFNCKPPKIKSVETNCAGDVFHGAFAAFMHKKYSIMESMGLATATATLKCTKNGGIYSIPSYSSVKNFVKKIQIRKI